jgi:hypothetical protein
MDNPIIFRLSHSGFPESQESREMLRTIKFGDFIAGLTYTQLLEVEKMLKRTIPNIRIVFTGTGYGYVSHH